MNPIITDENNVQLPDNQGSIPAEPNNTMGQGMIPQSSDTMPPAQPQAPSGQPGSQFAPGIAEDADLIEKEWVTRAKMIVAKTKDDPREQNKEISKFKADYLKKRYNKDIKVSE